MAKKASDPLTPLEFRRAYTAWDLAIREKLFDGGKASFETLVKQYGKSITNRKNLDAVKSCFNWDVINAKFNELWGNK